MVVNKLKSLFRCSKHLTEIKFIVDRFFYLILCSREQGVDKTNKTYLMRLYI